MLTDFAIFLFLLGLILGFFTVGITPAGREFFRDLIRRIQKLIGIRKEDPDTPEEGPKDGIDLEA